MDLPTLTPRRERKPPPQIQTTTKTIAARLQPVTTVPTLTGLALRSKATPTMLDQAIQASPSASQMVQDSSLLVSLPPLQLLPPSELLVPHGSSFMQNKLFR